MSMLCLNLNSASWCPPVNECDPGAINKSGQAGSNCWTDDAAAFWRVNSTSPYKHVGGFGIGRTRGS